MSTIKQPKLPKTLAACADRLYEVRELRLANDRTSKTYKDEETLLREHLIASLPKSEATGVAGKVARATIVTSELIEPREWSKIYDWVIDEAIKHRRKKDGREHEPFAIFQRTLTQTALVELRDNGVEVPGTGVFNLVKVSLNKV